MKPLRAAAGLLLGAGSLLSACSGDNAPTAPITTIRPSATAPAALNVVAGDGQTTTAETAVPIAPSVRVVGATGAPIAEVPVTFTAGPASGTVTGGTVRTDANGVATLGSWTLGRATTQTVTATSTALPGRTVVFTATATPKPSAFGITVRFVGEGGTELQRQAFTKAAARWAQVITGDIGSVPLNTPAGECDDWIPAVNEQVRNLLVFVRIAPIDGPAKIIAQASPCYVNSTNKLPIMGFFELDQDDLPLMLERGLLDDVVLHEMGHILGIGTLWNYQRSLLVGSGTEDPYFTGSATRSAFGGMGGAGYTGNAVPVENTGGAGTRDAHWRKSLFGNELMQGYAQAGGMPLSRVTVGSLQDLGYTVNLAAADGFSLLGAALRADSHATGLSLGDDIARAPLYEVTPTGSRRLVRPELE
jgi:hypothetical protein